MLKKLIRPLTSTLVFIAMLCPAVSWADISSRSDVRNFIAEMNKPVETYKLDTSATKTSNADKFDDLFN